MIDERASHRRDVGKSLLRQKTAQLQVRVRSILEFAEQLENIAVSENDRTVALFRSAQCDLQSPRFTADFPERAGRITGQFALLAAEASFVRDQIEQGFGKMAVSDSIINDSTNIVLPRFHAGDDKI